MLTKDRLAKALRTAELPSLAARAERGEWDALERGDAAIEALVRSLRALSITSKGARKLLPRVLNGEFYNTKPEIRKWIEDHPEVKA